MENDREFEQVLMNVRNTSGGISSAIMLSARMSMLLVVFIMRMVKKGLIAASYADNIKSFAQMTEGKYQIYNIPLSEDRAQYMMRLNEIELHLQQEKNPIKRRTLEKEKKKLKEKLPEIEQLKKLDVKHCVLPKLNGSERTIQIAVSADSEPLFKGWFINHLTSELSGGEKELEDIKNFTEGNYSIFNVPFEGEELKEVFPDFDTLGINYAVLPDLKVGDNNSQLVIPNTDRNKLEMWFKMWKEKQLRNGEQPGEIYEMDENSYMNTGTLGEEEYIGAADPKFQEANMQFEQNEKEIPGIPAIGKENSEEFIRLSQDNNYKKITINNDTLVENVVLSEREKVLSKQGFFISRIPGTYGEKQMTLILPKSQVFKTDEGKTFIAFIPKNKGSMVASAKGEVKELSFDDVMNAYDPVKRGFRKVEEMMKPEISPDIKPDIKLSPDMAKNIAGKGGPLPKIKP